MATTLGQMSMQIRVSVPEWITNVGPQGGQASFVHQFVKEQTYEIGTGANRINAAWSRPPTALSAPLDLDLRGSLTAIDGSVVAFPIICGIFIQNHSTTDAEILTIGGSTNPFLTWLGASGDAVKLGPGGVLPLWNPQVGYATTAGTGDILSISSASGTPIVSALILGRSA